MDIGQMVELIGNIAVILASATAIWGVSTWKREFKGKRDMRLAEHVLRLFYEAKDALEAIRCPILSGDRSREPQNDESPEEKEARDRAHAILRRIQDRARVFERLYAVRFRFMARFGPDTAKPFEQMNEIRAKITVSARELGRFWAIQLRNNGADVDETDRDKIKYHERIVFEGAAQDKIAASVGDIMGEIEAVCRPIIEAQRCWFSRLWRRAFAGKGAAKP